MDEKLIRDEKFLDDVRRAALDHKDIAVPYDRADLYQCQMFVLGVMRVLTSRGFVVYKPGDIYPEGMQPGIIT